MERLLAQRHYLGLDDFFAPLEQLVREKRDFLDTTKGNFKRFRDVYDQLPDVTPSKIHLDRDAVTAGCPEDLSPEEHGDLFAKLELLRPWRKGPFELFGVDIDAEWRSCLKWDRLVPHLPDPRGKKILDIGSSNGYYMFRMAAMEPRMVLGLEPQSAFYYQYLSFQKYLGLKNVFCLPVPHDQMPKTGPYFDLCFCMGVLYHRKSPVDMLKDIRESLKPGGTLVMENLIIHGNEGLCLFPRDRYAKMRNVFFLPDLAAMESMLIRAGFREVSCVDISRTTLEEQRKTHWIQTESLGDFLDPHDPTRTVEGYPGPVRGVFMAKV